jgi:hypothetical protein
MYRTVNTVASVAVTDLIPLFAPLIFLISVPFLTRYSRKKRGLYQGLANMYGALAICTYTT